MAAVARLWAMEKASISYPSYAQLYTKNAVMPWYTSVPDDHARRYAQRARARLDSGGTEGVPDIAIDPSSPEAVHFCSSLVCATWQAALGSLAEEGTDEEEELLGRLPMKATWARPTDWSLLPAVCPDHWCTVGIVTGFSEKRSFRWYQP